MFEVPLGVWTNEERLLSELSELLLSLEAARPEGVEWAGFARKARTRDLRYRVLEPIVIVLVLCAWTFLVHDRLSLYM